MVFNQIKEDFVLDIKIKLLDTNYHYSYEVWTLFQNMKWHLGCCQWCPSWHRDCQLDHSQATGWLHTANEFLAKIFWTFQWHTEFSWNNKCIFAYLQALFRTRFFPTYLSQCFQGISININNNIKLYIITAVVSY